MAKKRINIYVDEDIYAELKVVIGVTGDTVTDVVTQAMKEYVQAVRLIVQSGDKDKLMDIVMARYNAELKNIETVLGEDRGE